MRRRSIQDLTSTERFIVRLLECEPRTENELLSVIGGCKKHSQMLLKQLIAEGYVVALPSFDGLSDRDGLCGGTLAELSARFAGMRLYARSTGMTITHDWKFFGDGFEGVGKRELGLGGSLAGTVLQNTKKTSYAS